MGPNYEVNVPHFSDFFIDQNTIEEDARRLVNKIRPNCDPLTLKIKHFTEGITNRLIGCFPKDFDSGKGEEEDVILIRVYGRKTELFIDRSKEIANMVLINQNGLSPPVFCSFANGVAYGYSAGICVTGTMVLDEFIYNLICLRMAKMHSIAFNNNNTTHKEDACLFRLVRKYLSLIADTISPGDPVDNFLTKEGLTLKDLNQEVDELEEHLKKLGSPLVFCHNDLLLNNIIYDERKEIINFIDFEYADLNYQAFDIANHFNEFSGLDEYKPEKYPSKEFQLQWLSCYLKHWDSLNGDDQCDNSANVQFDQRVEELYIQVSKFSLASNIVWGVWALLQALHSAIEYDFLSYGVPRIREYFKKKGCIDKYTIN